MTAAMAGQRTHLPWLPAHACLQTSKGMPDVLVNFPDAFRRQVRSRRLAGLRCCVLTARWQCAAGAGWPQMLRLARGTECMLAKNGGHKLMGTASATLFVPSRFKGRGYSRDLLLFGVPQRST